MGVVYCFLSPPRLRMTKAQRTQESASHSPGSHLPAAWTCFWPQEPVSTGRGLGGQESQPGGWNSPSLGGRGGQGWQRESRAPSCRPRVPTEAVCFGAGSSQTGVPSSVSPHRRATSSGAGWLSFLGQLPRCPAPSRPGAPAPLGIRKGCKQWCLSRRSSRALCATTSLRGSERETSGSCPCRSGEEVTQWLPAVLCSRTSRV